MKLISLVEGQQSKVLWFSIFNLIKNFIIYLQSMDKLRVLQFEGLAPSVFCGMYFADQGAEVVLVARQQSAPFSMPVDLNIMNRNKKCITINLKNKQQYSQLLKLISKADIIIDPYRPGVLQKLKLGPQNLYQLNKKIILLRVSGYGQTGPLSLRPGHDLNYLSVSGILPLINKQGQNQFPSNYMADFVSASLGITGALAALIERQKTGEGKVVDCSLTNGCTYFAQKIIQKPLAEKDKKVTIFKNNNITFVCTSKNEIKYQQNQLISMIGDKDYFRSQNGQLQISRVKEIQGFDTRKLVNPFSPIKLSGLIKKKGQDNQQLQCLFKPKL